MGQSETERLRRDLDRLQREVTALRERVGEIHTLAFDSLGGSNQVTALTNDSLKALDQRLRALERRVLPARGRGTRRPSRPPKGSIRRKGGPA